MLSMLKNNLDLIAEIPVGGLDDVKDKPCGLVEVLDAVDSPFHSEFPLIEDMD